MALLKQPRLQSGNPSMETNKSPSAIPAIAAGPLGTTDVAKIIFNIPGFRLIANPNREQGLLAPSKSSLVEDDVVLLVLGSILVACVGDGQRRPPKPFVWLGTSSPREGGEPLRDPCGEAPCHPSGEMLCRLLGEALRKFVGAFCGLNGDFGCEVILSLFNRRLMSTTS
uniref:Uncharacterized protein n=1 Tax=Eutreptiella gymnastica TaxID=73025 RepID=A0A7S1J873_9EUGL